MLFESEQLNFWNSFFQMKDGVPRFWLHFWKCSLIPFSGWNLVTIFEQVLKILNNLIFYLIFHSLIYLFILLTFFQIDWAYTQSTFPYSSQGILYVDGWCASFKDTHREKLPSNKTPALTKSMNMDLHWYIKTSPYNSSLNWNKIFKKIK